MSTLCRLAGTIFVAACATGVARAQHDPKDWPTYNCDVIGSRHNRAEDAIDKSNAGRLDEKWRFPARDSDLKIGVIHEIGRAHV